jgi:hypothetical protein
MLLGRPLLLRDCASACLAADEPVTPAVFGSSSVPVRVPQPKAPRPQETASR